MDKKGEIYDLHEEIFNNGPLLKLTHEECEQLASFLVDTGYRKASDVVGEIFEEIEQRIGDLEYRANTTRKTVKVEELKAQVNWVLHEVVPNTIAELKKKYESEGEG